MAHPFRYLTLFCLLGASALRGQETRLPERRLHFTVFSAQPISGLAYELPVGPVTETVPVVFYPTARSPSYYCSGPGPLRFYGLKTGALVAEVPIIAGIEKALLIFSPRASKTSGDGGYDVHVFDDSATRYGPGQLMVLNFSGMRLAGALGRQHIDLIDGVNGPFSVGRSAPIQLRTEFNNKSYQAYAATIEPGRDNRALLLLLPPYYRGSLELQSRLLVEQMPGSPIR